MDKIDRYKYDIFCEALKQGGTIVFDKIVFPHSWHIYEVFAISCDEQPPIEIQKWNRYCKRVMKFVGAKNYYEWIYHPDTKEVVGFMRFKTKGGEEIKMKHFRKWKILLKMTLIYNPKKKLVSDFDVLQAEVRDALKYHIAPTKLYFADNAIARIFKNYKHIKIEKL